ncbi:MAG: HNH endonuclease [Rhabdaerophilum sp.]
MRGRAHLLHDIQHGRCGICAGKFRGHLKRGIMLGITVDEVVPRSAGGRRMIGNQVAAHWNCNQWKGSRPPNGCEIIMLHLVNARLIAGGHAIIWGAPNSPP